MDKPTRAGQYHTTKFKKPAQNLKNVSIGGFVPKITTNFGLSKKNTGLYISIYSAISIAE